MQDNNQDNNDVAINEKTTKLGGITGKGFMPGVSGNPSGRPKGTMKDYLRRKFIELSDEEKESFLITNKVSGKDQIEFGEGKAKNEVEVKGNLTISQVLDELDGQEIKGQALENQSPLQDQEQKG